MIFLNMIKKKGLWFIKVAYTKGGEEVYFLFKVMLVLKDELFQSLWLSA